MKMKLKLNRDIYDIDTLRKCANDYKILCDINILCAGNYFEISISNCFYDEQETVKEFCNYLIAALSEKS